MTDITFNGKTHRLPEYLDELSSDLYVRWLVLVILFHQGLITIREMKVKWMSALLGLRIDYTAYTPDIVSQTDHQLHLLDAFFQTADTPDRQSPRIHTCRQLLRDYEGWHGPADMLDGLSFGAFTDILTLLGIARKEDTPTDEIDRIYRDITLLLYTHPEPGKVPDNILVLHAATFFTAVWEHIQHEPCNINGELIDLSILFRSSGRRQADDRTGWTGITMEVAKEGIFGDYQSVRASSLWDVLLYLYRCKFSYLYAPKP